MYKIGAICRILPALLIFLDLGEPYMQNSATIKSESERLYEFLSEDKLHPLELEEKSKTASPESKNELMRRLAHMFEPAPPGRVLARLAYMLTPQNRADMTTAFLFNLRAKEPEARVSSLYGLAKLEYPNLDGLALVALRDDADVVLAAACQILLPKTKHDATLLKILQAVYAAHKGDSAFHMSVSLLEAHGIANALPTGR